ncbi:hypothetical protein QTP88_022540 [Uroleucon formosanum]
MAGNRMTETIKDYRMIGSPARTGASASRTAARRQSVAQKTYGGVGARFGGRPSALARTTSSRKPEHNKIQVQAKRVHENCYWRSLNPNNYAIIAGSEYARPAGRKDFRIRPTANAESGDEVLHSSSSSHGCSRLYYTCFGFYVVRKTISTRSSGINHHCRCKVSTKPVITISTPVDRELASADLVRYHENFLVKGNPINKGKNVFTDVVVRWWHKMNNYFREDYESLDAKRW